MKYPTVILFIKGVSVDFEVAPSPSELSPYTFFIFFFLQREVYYNNSQFNNLTNFYFLEIVKVMHNLVIRREIRLYPES